MRKKKVIVFIIAIFIYILMSLPVVCNAVEKGTLTDDINGIDENKYPGFKTQITNLQNKHPNYKFRVYYTGLNWEEVLVSEYQYHGVSPLNLFQIGDYYNGMWECPLCGTQHYDNGSWSCASLEAIAYMMDPRNSINESDVFQFKDLEGADASVEDITRAVSGYGSYLNNGEAIQAIYDASKQYNINPYFLIAKIVNEHGKNGSTLSSGKGYNGNYVGYYNYFNIGSYGSGAATIINSGLAKAQQEGWNSIRLSIIGGTAVVKESYIQRYSQNTLYYQKFNVSGKSALGSHQYQQNIMAAQSQGSSLKKYYGDSNTEFIFIIPLYENMPKKASSRPDPTVINRVQYFDGVIRNISSSLLVRSAPGKSSTKIGALNNDESIKIIRRATEQVDGYYWDTILSNKSGVYGYAARIIGGEECIVGTSGVKESSGTASNVKPPEPDPDPEPDPVPDPIPDPVKPVDKKDHSESIKINENNATIHPDVTIQNIIAKYENAIITNANGEEVKEGNLGTGYKIKIGDKEYVVVKKGDIDGDTSVTVVDAVLMINAIKGTKTLENEYKLASILSDDEENCSIVDAVRLLNFIKGTYDFDV